MAYTLNVFATNKTAHVFTQTAFIDGTLLLPRTLLRVLYVFINSIAYESKKPDYRTGRLLVWE